MARAKKNKVGRKPDQDVERYPCGKIKRRNEKAVALEARRRQYGISKELADSQEGGNAAKRLLLQSMDLDKASRFFDAIDFIEESHTAYRRAIRAPVMRSAASLEGARGHDNGNGASPGYVRKCQHAIRVWDDIRGAILRCRDDDGKHDPFAMLAVVGIVIENQHLPNRIDSLLNALEAVDKLRFTGEDGASRTS